jgi:hypothetical protein
LDQQANRAHAKSPIFLHTKKGGCPLFSQK